MLYVAVEIVRFVEEHQPSIVECRLVDAYGQPHFFVEKCPIVSVEYLDAESTYPQPGSIACEVSSQWTDDQGRALREINTMRPWGVEATSGKHQFVVLATQVSESHQTTSPPTASSF